MTLNKKIGIALSGGGYRGVAHVGLLQFLEEKQVPISVVGGTSAGAIVGSLYAAGLPAGAIRQVFLDTDLFEISLFRWRGPGLLDTPRFKSILEPHLPKDDFSALDKELYIVATDLLTGKEVVMKEGKVSQAVLASAAFPGIFAPVEVDGMLLADGGIVNNLPADIVRNKSDVVIGSDVNPINPLSRKDISNTYRVIKRAMELSTRYQAKTQQAHCDVYICPADAIQYPLFDSSHVDELFELGYRAGKKHESEIEKILQI